MVCKKGCIIMSKNIAIDLDGVIFDTERYFRVASEIEDVNNYGLNNKIDNRNVRFQDRYNWDKNFEESFYAKNVYDIEEKSGIMPGASYVLSYLKSRGYKLYVITARGFFSQKQIDLTNMLLKRYDLYNMFEKIIYKSSEKLDKILEYKIDYMIDDNLNICKYVKDACTPIYFKDGPVRSSSSNNIITVNNWGEIYRYFYNQ